MNTAGMEILRCKNCGGAMAPDQGKSAYVCPYCASVSPFTEENYYKHPPIRYRHRARQIEGGKFSVLHTQPLVRVENGEIGWLRRANRLMTIDEKLEAWGAIAEYADIAEVFFACCNCGGEVTGEEIQNMFCAHTAEAGLQKVRPLFQAHIKKIYFRVKRSKKTYRAEPCLLRLVKRMQCQP